VCNKEVEEIKAHRAPLFCSVLSRKGGSRKEAISNELGNDGFPERGRAATRVALRSDRCPRRRGDRGGAARVHGEAPRQRMLSTPTASRRGCASSATSMTSPCTLRTEKRERGRGREEKTGEDADNVSLYIR